MAQNPSAIGQTIGILPSRGIQENAGRLLCLRAQKHDAP